MFNVQIEKCYLIKNWKEDIRIYKNVKEKNNTYMTKHPVTYNIFLNGCPIIFLNDYTVMFAVHSKLYCT